MDPYNDVKVIRAPSLKRGKNDEKLCDRIKLRKVLGLTVCSNAALDVSQTTGILAYPAGCTVVLFNSKKLNQSFLLNSSRKAITAVAYSQCGRYLATGECGLNPAIKVWELEPQTNTESSSNVAGNIVAEFSGHKYAVNCVAFSPTGKYLVSVGSQHDMIVNVFDWKQNLKIASNKVSAKVVAVSFCEDGNYFVTVGNRHVKYWYLEGGRRYREPQPTPLMGRSAILGELRNNDFCAVACGKGEKSESTYAITRNGHLVEFNARRLLDKWVACRTTSANCICVSSKYILVGCAESIIRCFNAENLEYITTLPRTHYLGVDVSQGTHINHMMSAPPNAKYPDTIAIVFDEIRCKVSCVYNDHSLYIWDLKDIRRVGKSHSFLYHSACIWGVETVPLNFYKVNNISQLPLDSFLTCSSDDTIRVWGIDGCEGSDLYRKNIYSKDLLKIIYIDNDMNFIKDMDNPILNEKTSNYDGRNGVRSIKISPDRTHLATGDRSGNIRIYNIASSKMITSIEAHDSEVLCLEYTNEKIDRRLLASASRDRLIHVFDCLNGYSILQTLDDHSSSITSVRFIGTGLQFHMISCGADKSIIFRNFQNNQFLRGNNCSGKNTLYDMEVDSNSKHILTACQDRNIRVYGTQNAKHTKTFKGSHSDDGSLIKLSLDLSGIYVATSCTDKTLSVFDYYSNECMARMYGHSELVTGLKFTNDCKHLISASGDGCVFIWQVPHDMIITMQARLSQQALRFGHQVQKQPTQTADDAMLSRYNNNNQERQSPPSNMVDDNPSSPTYKFSEVGQLPQWAKRKPSADETSSPGNISQILGTSPSQIQMYGNKEKPKGRWAQRTQFEPDTLDLRNIVENNTGTGIPINNNVSSDYNSSSSRDIYNNQYPSEDSSIDSGMENRRDLFLSVRGYVKAGEQKNSLNSESNTEHDGDVEDISDGERTSSEHGVLFYPTVSPGTPTEFKVNEMNETELRKSIRRQKLEKQGLSLAITSAALSTGTGTGTSDDDDEGSTPSGDNAERSLASTLGGSSESIPQQTSSTFLQTALDGIGLLERGSSARKSISAMHNNSDGSKAVPPSLSKSFTNTKKEELMKIINDAKQKLEHGHIMLNHKKDVKTLKTIREVGYRSNLRTSQSISDLSHAANMDLNYRGNSRIARKGDTKGNYLNSAASKSVLTQNSNLIRQIQKDYPPYPSNIGIYSDNKQFSRPNVLEIPLKTSPLDCASNVKMKKHPGILKNHKSCPVSPVHEEMEWSTINSKSSNITFNEPKRHSMFNDDARSILDMIHADTEKMIAEITQKYGDLDNFNPSPKRNLPEPPEQFCDKVKVTSSDVKTKLINKPVVKCSEEIDGNFSSDSLEDCSLNLDLNDRLTKRKNVCKKHSKTRTTLPKRSVSDYFIYDSFNPLDRKVSLSDILDDTNEDYNKNNFLDTQRHSSASFFLGQKDTNKSQESILSEDFSGEVVSYYNSMESILSDDSECKSAPLEVLFGRGKYRDINNKYSTSVEITSKSYGSSPNTVAYDFDYYMLHERYRPEFEMRSPTRVLPTSATCPSISLVDATTNRTDREDDFIPSLTMKNYQYNSAVSKSLSKEFAYHRQHNNSNPLSNVVTDIEGPNEISSPRKSCSFEICINDPSNNQQTSSKRFEKNLEKFNRDQKLNCERRAFGGTLEMGYVPHKPPVAQRRTSSMKSKTKPKLKDKPHVPQKNFVTRDYIYLPIKKTSDASKERIFDFFVLEKEMNDNCHQMDSLDMYNDTKKLADKENSVDSLDDVSSSQKYQDIPRTTLGDTIKIDRNLMTSAEYTKFRDIEKKIDVINKLVEMEERKLENERILKENRMRPFDFDLTCKGYVKNLTMNFDNLAKTAQLELEIEKSRSLIGTSGGMKRNFSLPDVLEGAKLKTFEFDDSKIFLSNCSGGVHCDFGDEDDVKGNQAIGFMSAHDDDDSSIRRACSLSDLTMGKGFKSSSTLSNQKLNLNSNSNRSAVPNRAPNKRITAGPKLSVSGMGMRSVSVGMLNQASDSEPEPGGSRGGILRPTISSQNKANGGNAVAPSRSYSNVKNSVGVINRRRGLQNAHSSVNLSSMGQDDSSSEEAPSVLPTKPIVPPRPRNISMDKRVGNITPNAKNRVSVDLSTLEIPCKDTNIKSNDLTSQCSNLINQLMLTANSVMQLHQRLQNTSEPNGSNSNSIMLKELENAVIMTQNMLTKITHRNSNEVQNSQYLGTSSSYDENNGELIQMMDKCSDILNKVQHANN